MTERLEPTTQELLNALRSETDANQRAQHGWYSMSETLPTPEEADRREYIKDMLAFHALREEREEGYTFKEVSDE